MKTAEVTNARISWNTEGISPGTYTVKVEGKARDISGKLSVIEGSAEVSVV